MMPASGTEARRGQPLWALGGVLLCWIGVRVVLFDGVPRAPSSPAQDVAAKNADAESLRPTANAVAHLAESEPAPTDWSPGGARAHLQPVEAMQPPLPPPLQLSGAPLPEPTPLPPAARVAAGHNLLWMAAMSAIPLLPEIAAAVAKRSPEARWSADGWLVWRAGTSGLAASATPVYGGSQAGAVLRYSLAAASPYRPVAYARSVQALGRSGEGDFAAGLALRPLPAIPVTAHGEVRLTRRGRDVRMRPAAFLSAGADTVPLVAGATARAYAQAGYVGGPGATAFADGSLIAEKPLWQARDSVLAVGAGTWGGAQRGAARLDLGPTASLRFRLGQGTARVSADYRLRVAGNAEPAAGAALTLSAGF